MAPAPMVEPSSWPECPERLPAIVLLQQEQAEPLCMAPRREEVEAPISA
jgi:hypothetical protein